jgi:hypothetical protein
MFKFRCNIFIGVYEIKNNLAILRLHNIVARLPDKSGASDSSYLLRLQATAPQCSIACAHVHAML